MSLTNTVYTITNVDTVNGTITATPGLTYNTVTDLVSYVCNTHKKRWEMVRSKAVKEPEYNEWGEICP